MPDHFQTVYAHHAHAYDRLVSREDMRGNLLATLLEIAPLDGADVVEFGAGTGRMTRLLALMAGRVFAFDNAPAMLAHASTVLEESGLTNWHVGVADNRAMPVPAGCADVVLEGWSFGHSVGWSPDGWREDVGQMLAEMRRTLRAGGTAILLETLGTGNKQPAPPNEGLAELYAWWEREHGFNHAWIRTDYQFESVAEASELTRFFFGEALAARVEREKMTILPECTGVWWRTY